MIDWLRVVEEVAFAGPSGISKTALLAKIQTFCPAYKFDTVTSELVWQRTIGQANILFLVRSNMLTRLLSS